MSLSIEEQKQAYIAFMAAAIPKYLDMGYTSDAAVEKTAYVAWAAVQQMKRDFS